MKARDSHVASAIFVSALAVRLAHLRELSTSPTFFHPIVDSGTYVALASRLASGHGAGPELFWQSPFYPLFLAAVRLAFGPSLVWPRLLQVLLGCTTAVLTWSLGRRVFGRDAGLVAGAIVALYGPLVFLDTELLAASWGSFWAVALLILFQRVREAPRPLSLFGLGVACALSVATLPTFVPFVLSAGAWWSWRSLRSDGVRAAAAGLVPLLFGACAICVPLALASRAYSGRLSILPASGAINLYIGNSPEAADLLSIRPGREWDSLTRLPARFGVVRRQDTPRFFLGRFRDFVATEPLAFLRGLGVKSLQLVSSREIPRNVDLYVYRKWSRTLGLLAFKLGPFGFPFGLLLPLAMVGLLAARSRVPPPLVLFLLSYSAAIVLVFVSGRYRAPLVPPLAALAGAGLVHVARAVRARSLARLALVAVFVPLLPLSSLPGPFPQERTNYEAEMYSLLGSGALNEGDPRAALPQLHRAIELDSDHPDAHHALGLALSRLGQTAEARRELETAIAIDPRSATAHGDLARLLAEQGDLDGAVLQFRLALAIEDRSELRAGYGRALARRGDLEEAAHQLDVAAQLLPEDAAIRAELEAVLRRLGRAGELRR